MGSTILVRGLGRFEGLLERIFRRTSLRNLARLRITGNSELGMELEFTYGMITSAVPQPSVSLSLLFLVLPQTSMPLWQIFGTLLQVQAVGIPLLSGPLMIGSLF